MKKDGISLNGILLGSQRLLFWYLVSARQTKEMSSSATKSIWDQTGSQLTKVPQLWLPIIDLGCVLLLELDIFALASLQKLWWEKFQEYGECLTSSIAFMSRELEMTQQPLEIEYLSKLKKDNKAILMVRKRTHYWYSQKGPPPTESICSVSKKDHLLPSFRSNLTSQILTLWIYQYLWTTLSSSLPILYL